MLKKFILMAVVSIGLFIGSAVSITQAAGPNHHTTDVIRNMDGSVIGSSTLMRKEKEIKVKLEAGGLQPGAYSVWWIITNTPGEGDGNPSTLWAAGQVVEADGQLKLNFKLKVGETPGLVLSGNGLTHPFGANVMLLSKYHGPASDDPDELEQQLGTPNYGCDGSCPNAFMATHEPMQ